MPHTDASQKFQNSEKVQAVIAGRIPSMEDLRGATEALLNHSVQLKENFNSLITDVLQKFKKSKEVQARMPSMEDLRATTTKVPLNHTTQPNEIHNSLIIDVLQKLKKSEEHDTVVDRILFVNNL